MKRVNYRAAWVKPAMILGLASGLGASLSFNPASQLIARNEIKTSGQIALAQQSPPANPAPLPASAPSPAPSPAPAAGLKPAPTCTADQDPQKDGCSVAPAAPAAAAAAPAAKAKIKTEAGGTTDGIHELSDDDSLSNLKSNNLSDSIGVIKNYNVVFTYDATYKKVVVTAKPTADVCPTGDCDFKTETLSAKDINSIAILKDVATAAAYKMIGDGLEKPSEDRAPSRSQQKSKLYKLSDDPDCKRPAKDDDSDAWDSFVSCQQDYMDTLISSCEAKADDLAAQKNKDKSDYKDCKRMVDQYVKQVISPAVAQGMQSPYNSAIRNDAASLVAGLTKLDNAVISTNVASYVDNMTRYVDISAAQSEYNKVMASYQNCLISSGQNYCPQQQVVAQAAKQAAYNKLSMLGAADGQTLATLDQSLASTSNDQTYITDYNSLFRPGVTAALADLSGSKVPDNQLSTTLAQLASGSQNNGMNGNGLIVNAAALASRGQGRMESQGIPVIASLKTVMSRAVVNTNAANNQNIQSQNVNSIANLQNQMQNQNSGVVGYIAPMASVPTMQ